MAPALGLPEPLAARRRRFKALTKRRKSPNLARKWTPVSDRKLRVGIVGYGVCRFGAAFSFQDHPNVTVAAVSDLFPDRCAELAKACRCEKTYPSLEEMIKDDTIEAVFVATDAPSHARHCIDVLKHGKHVACAVPRSSSLEDADKLFETVKASGLAYMMFETSYFRPDCYAMRTIYNAGGFGKLVYSEGEYYHYAVPEIASYKELARGAPARNGIRPIRTPITSASPAAASPKSPAWPCRACSISCGPKTTSTRTLRHRNRPAANERRRHGADGRELGHAGRRRRTRQNPRPARHLLTKYQGLEKNLPDTTPTPLPQGVAAGGHGGSHGRLMDEFVQSILQGRKPLVDVAQALNMSVAGVVSHLSALKDGELMKIPQYKYWA